MASWSWVPEIAEAWIVHSEALEHDRLEVRQATERHQIRLGILPATQALGTLDPMSWFGVDTTASGADLIALVSESRKRARASRRWAFVAASFFLLGLLGLGGWWALATFRQGPGSRWVSRLDGPAAQDRETVYPTPGAPQAPGPSVTPSDRLRRSQQNADHVPPAAAPVLGAVDASKAPAESPGSGPLEMVPSEVPGGGYTIDLKGRYQVETRITGGAPQ